MAEGKVHPQPPLSDLGDLMVRRSPNFDKHALGIRWKLSALRFLPGAKMI
jgi:hypothetical protein